MKTLLLTTILMSGFFLSGCAEPSESSDVNNGLLPENPVPRNTGYANPGVLPDASPTPLEDDGSVLPPLDSGEPVEEDVLEATDGASDEDTGNIVLPEDAGDTGEVKPTPDAVALPDTTDPIEDVAEQEPDTSLTPDAVEFFDADMNGTWWLVANPKAQDPCGFVKEFKEQGLDLTLGEGDQVSGVLKPPGDFITLSFEGTFDGSELNIVAHYTEAGPPSIGWATEHTYTLNATLIFETGFVGTYVQEMVPNDGPPCTLTWPISGAKQ